MTRLRKIYEEIIVPNLKKELGINNVMALPKLEKVLVNVGIGKIVKTNPKFNEIVTNNIIAITGQKPSIRKAKKAISGFKVRAGDEVGLTVTLRGDKMYDFLDKLTNVTLPRLRDFRGLNPKSFDQNGNFTIGIKEQIVFPEITHEKAEIIHGLEATIVIRNGSNMNSKKLLEELGFPFMKENNG